MRVALDVTALLTGTTGVARYVVELGSAIEARGITLCRFAIGRVPDGTVPAGTRWLPIPLRAVHRSWAVLGWPSAERLAPDADVVHTPDLLPPPSRRPLVMTILDVVAVEHPDLHPRRAVALQRRQIDAARKRAAVVVTPSHATADSLAVHGIPRDRVLVTGAGAAPLGPPDKSILPAAPYLLAVGALTPRKGLGTLVAAMARSRLDGVKLVLAGPDGWGADDVFAAIERHGMRDRVLRLGRLSDAQLAALYGGCLAVCVPSIAEGFGLTTLEALRAGAPLVVSDIPVFREVVGDAALFVRPGAVDEWASALEGIASDNQVRRGLAARGPTCAARYTWERAAEITVAAYELAVATR